MKKWRQTMNAYDETFLNDAQYFLGELFETGVYVLDLDLEDIWMRFLFSNYSLNLGAGDPFVIFGKSGSEAIFEISGKRKELPFIYDRTPEFWLGWALAYYQWERDIPFSFITRQVNISDLLLLYKKYHEIDITHFCDEMDRIIKAHKKETNLKRMRINCGYTQKELALLTSIPLRTIQQYEQGQKNINNAQANYVISLAQALNCSPKELLE